MLRRFDNFWLSLVDKVTTGTYNFVCLIVEIILLALLSLPAADKTQYFVNFSVNSTLQLINCISNDLQKLLKYVNGAAVAAFFRIPLALFGLGWASVLALCLKNLKLLS